MSILKQTRAAVDRARRKVTALLDVSQVPDGHPVEKKVNSAFSDLEEALAGVRKAGRNSSTIDDPGPAVYVVPNKDIRDWPTTDGPSARVKILPRTRQGNRLASQSGRLVASRSIQGRRVISSREYMRALEDAEPVPSPFEEIETEEEGASYTHVLI